MADDRPQIIIKKIKKVDGGHHGGAWKVAYADFVTAMMAFFLLLWLLNVTTDEQKFGIANYFDPISVSKSVSGSGGVLGGKSMIKEGAMISPTSPMGVDMQMPGIPETGPNSEESAFSDEYGKGEVQVEDPSNIEVVSDPNDENLTQEEVKKLSEDTLNELVAEQEQKQFEETAEQIRQALQENPDLTDLAPHLIVDQTPEGLRIQIIDQEGRSMYPSGSARLYEETKELIGLVSNVIQKLPNKISITGHTDSKPFSTKSGYNNWNLSADRANSSREAFVESGFPTERLSHVVGKADTEHLIENDPESPRNRRVSIILLRENKITNFDPFKKEEETTTQPLIQTPAEPDALPVDALEYNQLQ